MKIEKFVELLKKDLEMEYSSAIQYINCAAIMRGSACGDIINELKRKANQEIEHAMILAEQIHFLGGNLSVKVGAVLTVEDNDGMLEQDLNGEKESINRYKLRIQQAEELKEISLANHLRKILASEQTHTVELMHTLGK
jgi:bacterioferritin